MQSKNFLKGKSIFESNSRTSGYDLLAIAICNKAAEDYRKAMKNYHKDGIKPNAAKQIERFFKSQYGFALSFGLGELILERLQKECEAGKMGVKHPRNSKLFREQ